MQLRNLHQFRVFINTFLQTKQQHIFYFRFHNVLGCLIGVINDDDDDNEDKCKKKTVKLGRVHNNHTQKNTAWFAFYDIRPVKGSGLFFQTEAHMPGPRSQHGAWAHRSTNLKIIKNKKYGKDDRSVRSTSIDLVSSRLLNQNRLRNLHQFRVFINTFLQTNFDYY